MNFMTTINATINSLIFGSAATRIDIWHEGGGIGRWEIMLDNSSGASQILSANLVASNLGINGTNFMQGYVDDVLPEVRDESAVFSKYVKVVGRNYGRDLANLFIINKYAATKFDDMVDAALLLAGSEITYTSPSTAPVVDADFNKTYLQNGFVEPAKLVDYDFTVKNDKAFELWALASAPSSGVLLKSVTGAVDNNILLINPETKAGVDIRNYIRIDAGALNDHYTEGNAADFTGVNCTAADDTSAFVAGASSIKATILTNALATLYLQFPKYNQPSLDFSVTDANATIFLAVDHIMLIQIYAKDDAGNEIILRANRLEDTTNWAPKIEFKLGSSASFGTGIGQWFYLSGSNFTWNITRLGVIASPQDVWSGEQHFWVDGLKIDGVNVWAYAEDVAGSQATYSKRMIPLIRTDVKSQLQLQSIADAELVTRKGPVYKLNLTCTLQTGLLYSGYLVSVLAPTAYIGYGSTAITYRILSIHHTAEPGVNLCKGHDATTVLELIRHDGGVGADPTRFKLASSPQAAINTRYDSRLRVLEGSLTGSGSIVGGGGGGGVVDWWNVPYIRVQGDSYFLGDVSLSKKLKLVDPDGSLNFIDLKVVMLQDPAFPLVYNPFLDISEGIICHKDVFTYGFVGSASPLNATGGGCIQVGARFEDLQDPPRINLTQGDGVLAITNGSTISSGVWNLDAVLAGLKCNTIYADNLKKVNGDAWAFTWDGGLVNNDITITKAAPVLELKSTAGNSELRFSTNGTNLIKLYQSQSVSNHLRLDADFVCDHALGCNTFLVSVATGTAPITTVSTSLCTHLNADLLDGCHANQIDADKLDGYHASEIIAAASASGIQRGSSSTNASGVATVNFASAFGGTPSITVTPVDASGRSISIVITAQSYTGFSVKATTIASHSHSVSGGTDSAGSHSHSVSGGTDSAGSHDHAVQGSTNYHDVAHGHGFTGTISDAVGHTHTVTAGTTSATTTTQSPSGATPNHTHNYTVTNYPNVTTNSSGAHGHGYSFTVGQSTASHNHNLADVLSDSAGSHTHTVSGSTDAAGSHDHSVSGSTSSSGPASISIAFNWIAVP